MIVHLTFSCKLPDITIEYTEITVITLTKPSNYSIHRTSSALYGQSNYALANASLDSLALARQSCGLAVCSFTDAHIPI